MTRGEAAEAVPYLNTYARQLGLGLDQATVAGFSKGGDWLLGVFTLGLARPFIAGSYGEAQRYIEDLAGLQ